MQKIIFLFLLFLNVTIQYQTWFGINGIRDYHKLQAMIKRQIKLNEDLQKHNNDLSSLSLSSVDHLSELKARMQFNLMKPNEIMFLITDDAKQ